MSQENLALTLVFLFKRVGFMDHNPFNISKHEGPQYSLNKKIIITTNFVEFLFFESDL